MKATALDARLLGFVPTVLTDAIAAVDMQAATALRALDEMRRPPGCCSSPPGRADRVVLRRVLAARLVAVPSPGWSTAGSRAATDADGRAAPLEMLAVVDAPIETTWAVVADIPRQLEWMREMKRVSVDTPGPVRVGTTAQATVRILGIAGDRPGRDHRARSASRYAIRHLGLFAGDGLITLEAGADGSTTVVRWEERLAPPVLPRSGRRCRPRSCARSSRPTSLRLKRLVETGAAAG